MNESTAKLPQVLRKWLVSATIREVAKVRERKSAARGPGLKFDAGVLLAYTEPEQEERFMRFIHGEPLGAILWLHVASAVSLLVGHFLDPNYFSAIFACVFFLTAGAEAYIHVSSRRLEGDDLHGLLVAERVLICVPMAFAAAVSVIFSFQVLADCSRLLAWEPIGNQPKAYTQSYCQYWSTFISTIFGVMAVLRIIRFTLLVPASLITVLLTATLWLAPGFRPAGDTAGIVVRVNLLTLATCLFVCIIRFVDEKQQRKHFEAQERLVHSAELLSAKRVATLDRCLAVLPEAVSARLQEGNWRRSHVDTASDATVLVTSVHDFKTWSTSIRPVEVAALVASMQNAVDRMLKTARLERVGRLGDTTVAVGNLLERSEANIAVATIDVGRKIAALFGDASTHTLTLAIAVHMGSLEGVLQGAHYVRYEVRGAALDATRIAVQLCDRACQLVASSVIVSAVADDDHSEWFKDAEELVVESANGGESVTFHRLDMNSRHGSSYEAPVQKRSSEIYDSAAVARNGGHFVAGLTMLLGQGSTWSAPTMMLNRSGTTTESSFLGEADGEDPPGFDPLEIVTDRFGFFRFADDETEKVFRELRMQSLPKQAAKMWLGYAVFVSLILLVLLLELEGPFAVIGVILLVLAVLFSVGLAMAPTSLSEESMTSGSTLWTIVGVVVPLLTVFGCALSRPSLVGLDVRTYVAFGAFMRSYCFNDARLQAIGVPLFSLIAALQYLVPGAHDNVVFLPLFLAFILATILAARDREKSELRNYRDKLITEAVVEHIEEISEVQRGLLQSSMPRCVFDAAVAAGFAGSRRVNQAAAVVMVVRAARASQRGQNTSTLDRVLDLVMSTTYLSIAGVLGDDAVVVGPVPISLEGSQAATTSEEALLEEALVLGLTITQESAEHGPLALSVLVDQDTVAHVVELGEKPNYTLLGISATRLICVGADVSGIVRGLLVTDRVTSMVKASGMLSNVKIEAQAPMTVRGHGVLRWNRIQHHPL